METVISRDGTAIAYERSGHGPALILVDGAMCHRRFGPSGPLAALLAKRFTVYTYDRRGRGDSGDTAPYAVEREIEDLDAVIHAAGGSAFVCGVSSGAALALEAGARGLAISRLALFEPPYFVDDSRPPLADDYHARLAMMIATDRRGDAVAAFMKVVGVPAAMIFVMRFMPTWSKLKTVAHTLLYDTTIMENDQKGRPLSPARWRTATMPTLVLAGGKSPAWMRQAMQSLESVLPNARRQVLEGQTHMVKPKVIVPVLEAFFAGS